MMSKIVVKRQGKVIATIHGVKSTGNMTVMELMERVPETEQFLEQITGFRFHITFPMEEHGDLRMGGKEIKIEKA